MGAWGRGCHGWSPIGQACQAVPACSRARTEAEAALCGGAQYASVRKTALVDERPRAALEKGKRTFSGCSFPKHFGNKENENGTSQASTKQEVENGVANRGNNGSQTK